MKKQAIFLYLSLAAFIISCGGQKSAAEEESTVDAGTQVYSFKDSCQHVVLSFSLEIPLGEDSASMQIRDSLIADFIWNAGQPGYDPEGVSEITPYRGDMTDVQALVNHYGRVDYEYLLKLSKSDYEARMEYLEEDTMMSAEEKKERMDDVPMWAFDLNIQKLSDTLGIVVYNSQTYVYCGGAHGGVAGTGAITFDKNTGNRIARFIEPGATKSLQPLLRKGLLRYYSDAGDAITDSQLDERLQIDGPMIPQPQCVPYPNATGDSLIFTYGQYEIACYADGMPSFMLPVKDLAPFLTPEGKALIGKAVRF